jgi:hypothetical protein
MHKSILAAVPFLLASQLAAQNRPAFSDVTREFISVDAPVVALQHVRVTDGTGGPVTENQTIVIDNGLIRSVGRRPWPSMSLVPAAGYSRECCRCWPCRHWRAISPPE